MLFFVIDHSSIDQDIHVAMATPEHDRAIRAAGEDGHWFVIDRWSIKSELQASRLAEVCNGELRTSEWKQPNIYLWADKGARIYPRYDVIVAPQVGDEVSKGFNGDYYPCGKIVKVSEFRALGNGVSCRRVEAKDENGKTTIFWRRGNSATWLSDRTWALVSGRKDERNPSF